MTSQQDIGRRIGAVVLIGLGVLFLLGQTLRFDVFGFGWPFFVLVPGLAFLYFAIRGDANAAPLAVPGAIVTGTGAILFYQNFTNHWESWAYAWALYPVFLGLALTFMGERTGNQTTLSVGGGFVRWGSIAFVALWALFELVIFAGNRSFGNYLLPLVLIGAGLWLLMRGSFRRMGLEKPKRDEAVFTGPRVVVSKPKNGYAPSASDELRQEIDAALAEDDDQPPTL
jgi:hypothetical protein